MPIVYIVTAGSYSDYHIRRVFLDEEKAKAYSSTSGDLMVEEYETDDDKDLGMFRTVTASVEIRPDGRKTTDVSVDMHTTLDEDPKNVEHSFYFNDLAGTYNPRKLLRITRLIPLDVDEIKIEEEYARICDDIHREIEALVTDKGWSEQMIDDWIVGMGRYEE